MVPMLGGSDQGGYHRGADRATERREPVAGFQDAAGTGSSGREDGGLFRQLAQREGQPQQAAALSLECQDAFREDLCLLPVGEEDGLAQGVGADVQTGGAKRLGGGLEVSRGLQGVAG